ncbi:hypothetical protein [Stieleria varia]|uniref:Uncharacterized protein n=1 Tax=Stieleria varia TaxID=2528005 RepID=A0A5C6ARS6_9BACT|nr:hypothetical protein [Stieleria varia]TWU02278.1 hypothetical protein Pla52n_33280 [Stieleria varia]
MNRDKSISLDETFDDAMDPQSLHQISRRSPIASRASIGHGEYLVRLKPNLRVPRNPDFLYEDPPCPDWAYEGSPQCEGICVFVPDYDEVSSEPVIIGWIECCFGCGPDQLCATPGSGLQFYTERFRETDYSAVVTECFDEYESEAFDTGTPTSQRPAMGRHAGQARKGLDTVFLKVPSIYNPGSFSARNLRVGSEPVRLSMPQTGWRVSVTRNHLPTSTDSRSKPPVAAQHPGVTPTTSIDQNDEALSACVILPEACGLQQHWITVPESSRHPQSPFCYGQLITPSWTVILYRLPMPESNKRKPDCGCH